MAASRIDVTRWIETAKELKCKYILSVCDTFEYDDYPVYCFYKATLLIEHSKHDGVNMQTINEIIRINADGSVDEKLNLNNA